ncbi:hypothetical protein [Bacillus sp. ISL-46]|uniref:hypothetical protein n=1 Tax=Bacillus sp. ISL-46 TaxID=2819129 RepID=UPI001BE68834|nr:hypothetical protein [Bacillus sp. ISL-46]MBT2722325.1 hypothetical protein [Bacillus sp. ISL-46]
MPWEHKQPDLTNNPLYLEPRVTAAESQLADKATKADVGNRASVFHNATYESITSWLNEAESRQNDYGISIKGRKYNASGSRQTTTGTISSSSNQLTVSSVIDYKVGHGILIQGAGSKNEVVVLTVYSSPTASGNVDLFLNDVRYTINVVSGDTTSIVANKIATLSGGYAGWTVVRSGSAVTFTATSAGTKKEARYIYNSTGAKAQCINSVRGTLNLITKVTAIDTVTKVLTLRDNASVTVTNVNIYHDDGEVINQAISDLPVNLGGTIRLPEGDYNITTLKPKTGVTLKGNSIESTKLWANIESVESLAEIDAGIVQRIKIEDMYLNCDNKRKYGLYFHAQPITSSPYHGGLWYGTFKKLRIRYFTDTGLWLKGGYEEGLLPNQFNRFEDIWCWHDPVTYPGSRALKITGQVGQHTFTDSQFDGSLKGTGTNITIGRYNDPVMGYVADAAPAIINFITCTTQAADLGVEIDRASNINFNGIWLEDLYRGIKISTSSWQTNIKGCHFADACSDGNGNGYGVYVGSLSTGVIEGNYILGACDIFIKGDNHRGMKTGANYGGGKTSGIVKQYGGIGTITTYLERLVMVSTSSTPLTTITSHLAPGEEITVLAWGAGSTTLTLQSGGNLTLGGKTEVILREKETATFIKSDLGADLILVSVSRTYPQQANIPNTSGATLVNLELEVNKIKDALRGFGAISSS